MKLCNIYLKKIKSLKKKYRNPIISADVKSWPIILKLSTNQNQGSVSPLRRMLWLAVPILFAPTHVYWPRSSCFVSFMRSTLLYWSSSEEVSSPR